MDRPENTFGTPEQKEWVDPILAELYAAKDEISQRYGDDMDAMLQGLREKHLPRPRHPYPPPSQPELSELREDPPSRDNPS